MRSVRSYFESLFGNLPKATFIYDSAFAPIWQNAAADALEDPAAAIEQEATQCLQQMRGLAVRKGGMLYSLFPQSAEDSVYLAVQAEPCLEQRQQDASRVLKNASAKLNSYLNHIYSVAQQIGLDSEEGKQLGMEVHRILRMSGHLYHLMDRSGSKDYMIPIALDLFLQEYARAAQELKPQLELQLLESEPDLFVQMMPENMELILNVLVSNAYRFGGGKITLQAKREGEKIAICVWDQGPGVQEPERLFEWGYRTPDQKGALGLGFSLPTAKKLLELQGGSIAYQRSGEQTCFKVLLKPAEIPVGTRLAEWAAEPIENSLSQMRIELSDIL